MKSIQSYITEGKGEAFTNQVKYSKEDIKKWIKAAGDSFEVCNATDSDALLIYKKLNKKDEFGSTIEHVATYFIKKEELFTDDINLFGHEAK